jgi:hypothetical protein
MANNNLAGPRALPLGPLLITESEQEINRIRDQIHRAAEHQAIAFGNSAEVVRFGR